LRFVGGVTLGDAPPRQIGFRPGSFENLLAKFLPRILVRGVWVFLGLFFAAIPTLTIIGVLSWAGSDSNNAQRDAGYVRAIKQIIAPFKKPSWSTTEIAMAIITLDKLVPPPQFAASQTRLVAGLRAQAALDPRIARANARHDAVALTDLESQLQSTENTISSAAQEIVDTYNHCESDGFRTR
jgi:hypothetical protein